MLKKCWQYQSYEGRRIRLLYQIERKIFRVLSTGALTHRTLKRLFSTHFIFFSTGLDLQLFSLDLIYISINPLTRLLVPISDALMPRTRAVTDESKFVTTLHMHCYYTVFVVVFFIIRTLFFRPRLIILIFCLLQAEIIYYCIILKLQLMKVRFRIYCGINYSQCRFFRFVKTDNCGSIRETKTKSATRDNVPWPIRRVVFFLNMP